MIGIINYGAGNIFSLKYALERLKVPYEMVDNAAAIEKYSHIIIPGVGHAGAAMSKLAQSGMLDAIRALKKPVLGICVGMQLLTSYSEEGNVQLTGIIPLKTRLFKKERLKVPHMGWNSVWSGTHRLFDGIANGTQFYFVHSYAIPTSEAFTIATACYGSDFSAAIQQENFYGVQFHPEKSGSAGAKILTNFTKI